MKQPLDPNNLNDPDGGEFSWGPGMFPPGVANNEGQSKAQDNFGTHMFPPQDADDSRDNYARTVADRRTDVTDPESGRDFETLGNTDRYGAAPPLVRAKTVADVSQRQDPPPVTTPRKW